MSGGYTAVPANGLEELTNHIRRLQQQVEALQMPTGTQIFEATKKLEQALSEIGTYVDAYLADGFTTGNMSATGSISAGNITSTGNVTSTGTGTFTAGLNSVDVYSRVVTGAGGYTSTYTNAAGQMGQVPSSRRLKESITEALLDPATIRALKVVTYRYIDAVAYMGDDAPLELGVIAEDVHDLGLTFLVTYDEDGLPFGVNDRAMTFVALWLAQHAHDRLDALNARTEP